MGKKKKSRKEKKKPRKGQPQPVVTGKKGRR